MVQSQAVSYQFERVLPGAARDTLHLFLVASLLLSVLQPLLTLPLYGGSFGFGGAAASAPPAPMQAQPQEQPVAQPPYRPGMSPQERMQHSLDVHVPFAPEPRQQNATPSSAAQSSAAPAANPPHADNAPSALPGWLRPLDVPPSRSASPTGEKLLPDWWTEDMGASESALQARTVANSHTTEAFPQTDAQTSLGGAVLPTWFAAPEGQQRFETAAGSPGIPAMPNYQAAGTCTPGNQLALALDFSDDIVSLGNMAGDVYTVTVTNNGVVSTTEISLLVDPNQGFYFVGGSADASSSVDGALTLNQPGGDTSPNAVFTLAVADASPGNVLGPGETVQFTFRLGTTDNAKSGQLLRVTLQSGSPAPTACKSVANNIPTGRGNLVAIKSPNVQSGAVGDVVTWTITLRNNGLGDVYDPVLTDTWGSGLTINSITPDPGTLPATLEPEEAVVLTAVGTIDACTDLNNRVEAIWSIGNDDGSGVPGNEVSSLANIVYDFTDPDIAIEIEPLGDVAYCGPLDATRMVTVTNTGGPVQNLGIEADIGQGLTLDITDPDWTFSGGVYRYTPNGGLFTTDSVVTVPVHVESTGSICVEDNGDIVLTPVYEEVCAPNYAGAAQPAVESVMSPPAPTLAVEKAASTEVAQPGDTIFYTVTVSGSNPDGNIGTINITDALPSFLTNIQYSTSQDPTVQAGGTNLSVDVTPAPGATYQEQLFVQATVPDNGVCGGGTIWTNQASAASTACPTCDKSGSDSARLLINDPLGDESNLFTLSSETVELCNDSVQIQTAIISVSNGITWTGTVYNDPLDTSGGPGPLSASNVTVEIDGVDRTGDVSITLGAGGAPLQIDFGAIGTYSQTGRIAVTYEIAGDQNAATGDGIYFVDFTLGGYGAGAGPACDGGATGYAPAFVNLERGALNNLQLNPATLDACTVNQVELVVDGSNLDTALTDSIVVTFTTDASDIITPTGAALELAGAFAGETPTVTTALLGARQIVTFTFPPELDIDEPGIIRFPLYRPCGIDIPLLAGLTHLDRCNLPHSDSDDGGLETRESDISLLVPPITYTLNTDLSEWTFSVRNRGNLSATNVVITSTLPEGHVFSGFTASNVPAPIASAITAVTTTNGSREVVQFIIPQVPPNSRIQFDAESNVQACLGSDQLVLELTESCGRVNGTCGGVQREVLGYVPGQTALLSSNTQTGELPLCGQGTIRLTVKNSSAQSDEFNFIITDHITGATYIPGTARLTVRNAATPGSPIVANVPFSPTEQVTGLNDPITQTLIWDYQDVDASYDPAVRELLNQRAASDEIIIEFDVQTYCVSTEAQVQSTVSAQDVCRQRFTRNEDSISLIVDEPALRVQKEVKNTAEENTFGENVLAGVGDTLVWRVDVFNDGRADVLNLIVTDTLPAGFQLDSVSVVTTSQTANQLNWLQSGNPFLLAGDVSTYLITGTVAPNACAVQVQNVGQANFGCGFDDICLPQAEQASALIDTKPEFTLNVPDTTLDQCGGDGFEIVIDFTNNGARAQNGVLTYTLPAGFAFAGIGPSTTLTPTLAPAVGATGTITFSYASIAQESSESLGIRLQNDPGLSGVACAAPGDIPANVADMRYEDTCGTAYDDVDFQQNTLTVLSSDISGLTHTQPNLRIVEEGQVYPFEIRVPNSGDGAAHGLIITETLASGWQFVSATSGSPISATPVTRTVGNTTVITWNVGTLPAGQTWTASVSARALDAADNYRATLNASTACQTGGCLQEARDISYNSALQEFSKNISHSPLSVGDPFSYTIQFDLYGNRTYTDVLASDTLPTLDGTVVFSPTLIEISNENGVNSWQSTLAPDNSTIDFTTVSGDAVGPESVLITVTGFLLNETSVDNNDTFVNSIELTYFDDGQPYAQTRTATGQVREPILTIVKAAVPDQGIVAGDRVTYTLRITHAAASTADAYDLDFVDVIPDSFTYAPGSFQSTPAADDAFTSAQLLTATYATLALGDSILITYSVTVDASAEPSSSLTNTAIISHTSRPGDDPNERTGSGVPPNDYNDEAQQVVTTSDVGFDKILLEDREYTIGEPITYSLLITLPVGVTRDVVITDSVPAGLRFDPTESFLSIESNPGPPTLTLPGFNTSTTSGDGSAPSTFTLAFNAPITHTEGAPARITYTFRLIVADVAAANHGDTKPNAATISYINAQDQPRQIDSSQPTVTLVEPLLVVEKSVTPQNAKPDDTVFYEIRIYHAATSTVPAYNIYIADEVPAKLQYSIGSWELTNEPFDVAGTGVYTDNIPWLQAYFPVLEPSLDVDDPLILRYQAVVKPAVSFGSLITNVVTTTWASLADDPFGDTRDGSGGVDDYQTIADAQLTVADVALHKSAPLTIVAGSLITYEITVHNIGPLTATDGLVRDVMPFQVNTITATYDVPTQQSGPCNIIPDASGDIVLCSIGDIPENITATVLVVGRVDPNTPVGADLTNRAELDIVSPDGNHLNNATQTETEVSTRADLGLSKSGPATAVAGEQVTYTLTLTNHGPSTSRGVDVKDLLPPGVTFDSGTTSQGICVNAICQLNEIEPGSVITMVITGTVGSDVTGVLTNTAAAFSSTYDPDKSNNQAAVSSTANTLTALRIVKTDLTDPVYAGDTYFYEIVITNTGPSDAQNVVISDTLPGEVTFEGASADTCTHNGVDPGGVVACALGTLAAGETRDFIVNARVNSDVISGTVGTNTVAVTTTTPVDPANSVLSDSEETVYLQRTGQPTDLALQKSVTPGSVVAGRDQLTYTLVVTNNGPAPASAVQVVDAYPRDFEFVSASTSRDASEALCSNGGTCDLGTMAAGDVVTITLVYAVPTDVAAGTYTNTAHVSSPAQEITLTNNTDAVPVLVAGDATLQVRKIATPDPATPGDDLSYTILITNTGPSSAANVTVSDTLPAAFVPTVLLSSRGGCTELPCNVGTLAAGESAWLLINGTVAPTATGALVNTATVSSTTPGAGDSTTITTPLGNSADLVVIKSATATAAPGDVITYTIRAQNLGPSTAANPVLTDTLPVSLTFGGVRYHSAATGDLFVDGLGAGICSLGGNTLICTEASWPPEYIIDMVITATVEGNVAPGTSLENAIAVGSDTFDPNALNNSDSADTNILGGAADLTIRKSQVAPAGAVTAGELVTYTITITNEGPGLARSVDVKEDLPPGMTLQEISASDGVCGGPVCQFGTVEVGETRTITVVARVESDTPAGELVNTAAVFSADDDDAPAANTDTVTTTIATEANLSVLKADLADPVGPTEGLVYELVVRNDGPSDAQNVVVTDTLDANVRFDGATPGCSEAGGTVTCAIDTLAAGAAQHFLLSVRVEDVISGTILTNGVTVDSSTADPDPLNNSHAITTTVQTPDQPAADLALTKAQTAPAGAVVAGESVTYTLTVDNLGPQSATNVRLLDLVPDGTQVLTMTAVNPADPSTFCSLGGSCYLGTVVSGTGVAAVTVVLRVDADYAGSSLLNTAHVAADQPDPDMGNNIASATTPVATSAALEIAKSGPAQAVADEVILYHLTVTNTGPSHAVGVVISDSVPLQTSFVSASTFCEEGGGIVTCAVGTLPAGASATALIQVRVDGDIVSPTTILNTAAVSATNAPAPVRDTATTTATQGESGAAALTIAKSATPAAVTAGETLTYTLTVSNGGPATAANVRVVDALPPEVTAVAVDSSQGLCTLSGVCELGNLPVNATATITFVVRVDSDASGTLSNLASVAASNPDSYATSNVVNTPVETVYSLGIAKQGPATVQPLDPIAYQIVVSNTGPSDAPSVVVTDAIPAGVTDVFASAGAGSCALSSGVLTCDVGPLAAGAQVFIAVNGTVSADATGTLTNTAAIVGTGLSDRVSTTVLADADLALDKRATASATAGETITYALTVFNHGPSAAENVVLTDTLPAGVTVVNAGGCLDTSNVLTCGIGTLAAGTSHSITITVTADDAIEPGTSLENTATVASDTPDGTPGNNMANADTSILARSELALEKRGPATVTAGELVTYTIVVTNAGPSTAQSVDVKDTLPEGVTLVGASVERSTSTAPAACGSTVCQPGDMPAGETITVTVVGQADSSLPEGTVLTNTATVFSASSELDTTDNSDSVNTTVGTSADLSVVKADLADPVGPSEGLVYELVVRNAGPSDAQNVVVTDTLDANVRFDGATPGCTEAGGTVTCAIDTLAAGAAQHFLLSVRVEDVISGTILTNGVTIASSTADPDPLNNNHTITTTVQTPDAPAADLALTKAQTAPAGAVVAGESVTYTLTVDNLGPQSATNVRLLDLVPDGTQVVTMTAVNPADSSAFCSLGGSCYLGTVVSGTGVAAVTVVLHVDANYAGSTLLNTAHVAADQPDPDTSNNIASATTPVATSADLSVSKVDLPDPVVTGETLLYQVVVTNAGPSAAQGVVLTDTLDANTAFVGGSPGCAHNGGMVSCAVGTLAAGERASVLLEVRVDPSLLVTTTLQNGVTVGSQTPDPVPANNSDTEETQVVPGNRTPVDLGIAKSAPATAVAGERITYTLVVTNFGPGVATQVQVVDALPEGVTFIAASSSQGLCNGGVFCELGDLPANATATVEIVGQVDSGQTVALLNQARVSAANPDNNPNNNEDNAVTDVTMQADLSIIKTVEPITVTPGSSVRYQLVVHNAGPSDAQSVVLTDTLPAALTDVRVSASQGSCAGTVICQLGTIAAGEGATVDVVATVAADANTTLTNTARVASATPDANLQNNEDTVTTAVMGSADLELDVASTPTAIAGTTAGVTVTVVNHGPSDAVGTVVTVTLPPSTSVASIVPPPGWFATDNGDGTVTFTTTNTLPPDTPVELPLTVNVDSAIEPGTSLEVSAVTTSDTPDPNPFNNGGSSDTSVIGLAELGLQKSGPPTVTAGALVTYTIVVTNAGPSTAQFVDVKDALPAGVALVGASVERTSSAAPAACGGTVCQAGDMPAGETITVTVVGQVDSSLPAGTVLTNTATVFSNTPDGNSANNSDSVLSTVETLAELQIAKTATPDPAVPGEALAYQIVVHNGGPSAAQSVTVSDTLPSGFTVLSVSSSHGECTALPCELGTLAAGESATVDVAGVLSGAVNADVVNRASVTSTTPLAEPSVVTTVLTTTISPMADLALFKDATPTANAGDTVVYTLTVRNNGPSHARHVVVTDTLPTQTEYVASSGCASDGGRTVICPDPSAPITLTAGAEVRFVITTVAQSDLEPGSSVENRATAVSTTPDPNPDNNGDDADTSIVGLADLVLAKEGPATVTAGEQVTYTIVVTNAGPSTAQFVDVKDALPPGVTLDSATMDRSLSTDPTACGGTVCQAGDVAAGEVLTVTVVGSVDPSLPPGTVLTNTATVFSDTPEPDLTNNEDSATSTVETVSSLQIAKHDEVDPVTQGGLLLYTIVVTNNGPSDAQNVTVVDSLPPGVTYQANEPRCAEAPPGLLTCSLGTVSAHSVETLRIAVSVHADLVTGTQLQNTATLTSTTPLTNSTLIATEETRVEEFLGPPADVAVEKVAESAGVNASGLITYTIVVTNYGPATATDVTVLDALPPEMTLVSATPSQGACDSGGTCSLGTLPFAGTPTTATIRIVARVSPAVANGMTLNNMAYVHADQPDNESGNNLTEAPVTVGAQADVRIDKQSSHTVVAPGEYVEYRLEVVNDGPANAVDVTVVDTLPANLADPSTGVVSATLTSGAEYCTVVGTQLTCALGDMDPGDRVRIEYRILVPQGVSGTIENTAVVESRTPEINPDNNAASTLASAEPVADLRIEKDAQRDVIVAGQLLTYTLLVHNNGPSVAQNVRVVDELPLGTQLWDAEPAPAEAPDPLVWYFDVLQPGETRVITVVVWVDVSLTNAVVLQNRGSVSSDTADPNPDNNGDDALTQVFDAPLTDLAIDKRADRAIVTPGDTLTYTVLITNNGPDIASGVIMSDTLPDSLTLVSVETTREGDICTTAASLITCQLAPIAPYRVVEIQIVATVNGDADMVVENTAQVLSPTTNDFDSTNDEDTTPVNLIVDPNAIELISFQAVRQEEDVHVRWATAYEENIWGFHIWRGTSDDLESATQLTSELIFAHGDLFGGSYLYVDPSAQPGTTYYYWIAEIRFTDEPQFHGPVQVSADGEGGSRVIHIPIVMNGAAQ